MALALAVAGSSTAMAQERVDLIPHRAVYDLALAGSSGTRGVESARGRIAFDFGGDACDGYTLTYRQVTELASGESGARTSDLSSTTFESPDGRAMRFRIENRGGGPGETIDGEAERQADGRVQVRLRQPRRETLTVYGTPVFPTTHIRRLIEAARRGETTLSVAVFDGTEGGKKVYDTFGVIGRKIEPGQGGVEEAARHDTLKGVARWPVTLSYYPPGSGERVPAYTLSFELYENGVSRALRLDYGDFALTGDLKSYDPGAPTGCAK